MKLPEAPLAPEVPRGARRDPIAVADVELRRPLESLEGLAGYTTVRALVRYEGAPLGEITVPVSGGRCPSADVGRAIEKGLVLPILRHLLGRALATPPPPEGWSTEALLALGAPADVDATPLVTVAVCTRDRPEDLARCLEAIARLDYPALDLLVVDNGPRDDASENLVRARHPSVRYVREPRPGLNWARNRALLEARGEVIAYTDDDAIVDPHWARALARAFTEDPETMAVTGLVVPCELETPAQVLFEENGGFGRGFERRWCHVDGEAGERVAPLFADIWRLGTGANMAFRRSLFQKTGPFDTALDVGTVTHGGGDLDLLFRTIKEGHVVVYEPRALVRHRHRREYAALRTQMASNGLGLFSYLARSSLAYPDERVPLFAYGLRLLTTWYPRRVLHSLVSPSLFPRDLTWAELCGAYAGLVRYPQARRAASAIEAAFGPLPPPPRPGGATPSPGSTGAPDAVAVRVVDASRPVEALGDVDRCGRVHLLVTWRSRPLGWVDIRNRRRNLTATRVREAIVDALELQLLEPESGRPEAHRGERARAAIARRLLEPAVSTGTAVVSPVPPLSVSIVVATRDRPEFLRACLRSLADQPSTRPVEIVVVDNHPESDLTPPVVAEFPRVTLVREARQGCAYARNAGIRASHGDIVVTTDDDVTAPAGWIERLVEPFARDQVMAVTGLVLPRRLETRAERLFEAQGGLARGLEAREVGRPWFASYRLRALPTWELGATANAAFRATVFDDPEIGLMDEALGPGTPTGTGEDSYLLYRILKAGHTLVYRPSAFVWHDHVRDMRALRRHTFAYSKGHVAYNLTTLLRDQDLRAVVRLCLLPAITVVWRLRDRWRTKNGYPLSLILVELLGQLAGPWALWRSLRRVRRLGRGAPRRGAPEATYGSSPELGKRLG